MKKYFVIALAAVALTACKKDDNNPTPKIIGEGEIILTTETPTKALLPNYQGNGNNFFPTDEIGFFMASEPTGTEIPATYKFWDKPTDPSVKDVAENAANFGYIFGTPYWSPVDPENFKLKYQKVAAVQMFAYYPRQNDNDGGTTPSRPKNPLTLPLNPSATTEAILTYQIPADQTDKEVLRNADLMWAKNTGETANAGYTLSSKPVKMTFNHLMSRINFGVKIFTTQPQTKKFVLRAIIVNGNEINAQDAKLNIVSGAFTQTAIPSEAYNGKVYYFDNENTPVFTAEVVPAATEASKAIFFADAAANQRLDILLYPFTQAENKNKLFFILSDDGIADFKTTYPTLQALQAAVDNGDKKLYSYSYEMKGRTENTAVEGQPNNGAWLFDAGVNNVLNVNIDVSSKAIDITTTIAKWIELPPVDVPAE